MKQQQPREGRHCDRVAVERVQMLGSSWLVAETRGASNVFLYIALRLSDSDICRMAGARRIFPSVACSSRKPSGGGTHPVADRG